MKSTEVRLVQACIVFVACSTSGTGELAVIEEHRVVRGALRSTRGGGFQLTLEPESTLDELGRQLVERDPGILHFAGHGAADRQATASSSSPRDLRLPGDDGSSGIYLQGKHGDPDLVTGRRLRLKIELRGCSLRLIVLNACWSDALAEELLQVAECVIGIAGPIADSAAVAFARAFYEALGGGQSVRVAFELAKNELAGNQLPDGELPRLRHREGIDPCQMFLAPAQRAQQPRACQEPNTGRTRQLVRSQVRWIGVASVISLALLAAVAAAAIVSIRKVESWASPLHQIPSPIESEPAPPLVVPARPAAEQAKCEEVPAPAQDAKDARDSAQSRGAQRHLPGQKLVPARRVQQHRAPVEHTRRAASEQQPTAPSTAVPHYAPAPGAIAMGQGRSPDEVAKEQVRRYVLDNIDRLRGCYEDQLLNEPALAGTVLAQFEIAPNGRVTSSEVTGLGDAVRYCVAAVIRGIEFPRSGGIMLVHYPFYFRLAQPPRQGARGAPTIGIGIPAVRRPPIGPGGACTAGAAGQCLQ